MKQGASDTAIEDVLRVLFLGISNSLTSAVSGISNQSKGTIFSTGSFWAFVGATMKQGASDTAIEDVLRVLFLGKIDQMI